MQEIEDLINKIQTLNLLENPNEGNLEVEYIGFNLNNNMAEAALNTLLTSLKLPDMIRDLPKFNGTKHTLHEFITNVDEIINLCEGQLGVGRTPTTFLRAIRNKIVEDADEVLVSYGPTIDWAQIKANLTTHYSDKRSETSLIRDLHTIFQGGDTIEKYYSKIIDIQSSLINLVRLSAVEQLVKTTKEGLYREMCLGTFLAGLKEPIGSMIRSRNPLTLSDAFNECIKEHNMYYLKNRNISSNLKSSTGPILKQFSPQYRPINSNNFYPNFKPFKPQIPQYIQQVKPQFNHQPNYSYNRPNFGQQNFRPQPAIPPPIPSRLNRVEPMDITSNTNKYKQPTRFNNANPNQYQFNTNGPTKFHSKELFNIENQQEITIPYEEYIQFIDFIQNNQDNSSNSEPGQFQDLDHYQDPQSQKLDTLEELEEPDETVFHLVASDNP